MRAKRKVGRPRAERARVDLGTVELRQKRARQLTEEALDLALRRQLIDDEQHEAGLRLRWLHCLKFGLPNVSAYNPDRNTMGGAAQRQDEKWRIHKENEYEQALLALDKSTMKRVVVCVTIFDKRPLFLRYSMRELLCHPTFHEKAMRELDAFKGGLHKLTEFFARERFHKNIVPIHKQEAK